MGNMEVISNCKFGNSIIALVIGAGLLLVYGIYRASLPKPLAGIPYNKNAAKSLLGDMPEMISHIKETGEMYDWLGAQNIKHESPIVQVFGRPLSKPWVIISDFRETQDILVRRLKEFDRSDFTADLLGGVIPEHHSRLKTNDEFKSRRRLVGDILTPSFLNKIAAPLLHESTMQMVNLWEEKVRLAEGRPFSALKDISHCALDAVLGFTFGPGLNSLSATQPNVDYLSSLTSLPSAAPNNNATNPVVFQYATSNKYVEAMFTVSDSLETAMKSLFPRLAHWYLRQSKSMRAAIQHKEDILRLQIQLSVARVGAANSDEHAVRCAIDEMVRRESAQASKENRAPAFHARIFYDELYGFVLGGHESTSNSNHWAVKLLASHQKEQNKLRSNLREALQQAVKEKRSPTAQEIMAVQCPYLEASIEELFRMSLTAPMCVRSAMQDTQILGYRIPKGTVVFQVWGQADYTVPGYPVDESLRTVESRAAHEKAIHEHKKKFKGDEPSTAAYAPERWLTASEDGKKQVFDPNRGRNMIFSAGPRGCYGRRLAYVEMRMLVVLIVWNFQLRELPAELNTTKAYDKLTREPHDCYVRLSEPEYE